MSDTISNQRNPANLYVYCTGLIALGLLGWQCIDSLVLLEQSWGREEYSYGYMIPMVSAFLIWKRREALFAVPWKGSYAGLGLLMLALTVYLLGELSNIYKLMQYAFWLALVALCLTMFGWRNFKILWGPLVYLLFTVPLPNFLYEGLSLNLQLISSQLGARVIELFGISVWLQGNVIDLGVYKLQVADACSGLRYLFPLMSFGFLVAYLYKGPLWQRAVLFASTVPVTILMNSFRIGVIGVLVEYWGIGMADGFLHYFEGWLVFMACLAVLVLEVALFHWFSKHRGSLWDRFDLDIPQYGGSPVPKMLWADQKPIFFYLVLLLIAIPVSVTLEKRHQILPERDSLRSFPLTLGQYTGREGYINPEAIDMLKLTDYLMADFRDSSGSGAINFYIAYYESQSSGAGIHSPQTCIPGDGWQITSLQQREIPSLNAPNGGPLLVNRVVIGKGRVEQLVYYWFQERGRVITNEYLAKWFIFWDALTKNRTDGALVRVVLPVPDGQDQSVADEKVVDFIRQSYPLLNRFVPD